MVEHSDLIIEGVIDDIDSHWSRDGRRVVTDIAVEVNDTFKGRANKSQIINLRLPGGRVGKLVTWAYGLPHLKEQEEVILYLRYDDRLGYLIVGGNRGKLQVWGGKDSGEKYVRGTSVEAQAALREDAPKVKAKPEAADKGTVADNRISLKSYKRYLRNIVKAQKKR